MPRTIQADGRTAIVPDDTTPDEINSIFGGPPDSVAGGIGRRVGDLVKGAKKTFAPPSTVGGFIAGPSLPLFRMAGGVIGSGEAAGKQAIQQAEQAHKIPAGNKAIKSLEYARALNTGLSALDPFASGTVANVNELQDEGRTKEAVGQAIPDVALLAAGSVGKVLPKINNPLTRAVTSTTPRETMAAVRTASEENAAQAAEHKTATEDALHETTGRELKHQQDVAKSNEEAEASKQAATRKHLDERNKAIAERQTAEEKIKAEKAKQAKIGPTQVKLRDAWSNLRAKVETARENALKAGNDKYSAVNEKLSPLPADMETVHGLYQEASGALGETQAVPSLLTRLGKSLQNGDPLSYKDEQALYSELGKELSKGTLPGSTYHAYDTLHEGIGKDMQRIADSQGAGDQLLDARNYWRRMKQTFGKPLSLGDTASKTVKGSASDVAAEDTTANQLRLLGSFDPEIPKQFNHVANVEKGAESLPSVTPERILVQKSEVPSIPARKPILPAIKKELAPPERVSPPDRPTDKIYSPRSLSDLKKQNLLKSTEQMRHAKSPLVSAVAGYGAIKALLARNLPTAGLDITARLLYGAAKPTLASVLENPGVVSELTKFTAQDAKAIAQLPPEARTAFVEDMSPVVKQAQSRGVRVSPSLLAALSPKKRVAAALSQ